MIGAQPMLLAFDLSLTSTGWAAPMSLPPAKSGLIQTARTNSESMARLAEIRDTVLALCRYFRPQLVLIEGYAMGTARSQSQSHRQGELGGVVRLALYDAGFRYVDVPPASLKKYATGKGNAKKEVVLAEAIHRLAYRGTSFDEADALWLLAMGMDHYGAPFVRMPQVHRAALDGVKWPELNGGA